MKHRVLTCVLSVLTLALFCEAAFAGSGSFTFTRPTNRHDTRVTINEKTSTGHLVTSTKATITPGMTAEEKRDAIQDALEANGYTVTPTGTPPQDPGITISGVRGGRKLHFSPGSTGEAKDSVKVPRARTAFVGFFGDFSPLD